LIGFFKDYEERFKKLGASLCSLCSLRLCGSKTFFAKEIKQLIFR